MEELLKNLYSARDAARAALDSIEQSISAYRPEKVRPTQEFSHVTADQIVEAVSQVTSTPTVDILGHRRYPHFVRARHIVWYLLRELKGETVTRIGQRFGVDHSTVSSGILKVERDYELMAEATIVMYQGLGN